MRKIIFSLFFLFCILIFPELVFASYEITGSVLFFEYSYSSLPITDVAYGVVKDTFVSYAETCMPEAEVWIQMDNPIWSANGEFGIKKVKINDAEVTIKEKRNGYFDGSRATTALFKGTISTSVLKNGENKIEIEFFTQCSDLQNSLACAIGAVLFGINSQGKIWGHIEGLRASANRPVVHLSSSNLDMVIPATLGEWDSPFPESIPSPPGVIRVGDPVNIKHDGIFFLRPSVGGVMTEEITNCFPELKDKLKWGVEFENDRKEASYSNSITINAPKKLTYEAIQYTGHPARHGIEDAGCSAGGMFPIFYFIPKQEFRNIRITTDSSRLPGCVAISQGYLPVSASMELTRCWDLAIEEEFRITKLPPSPGLVGHPAFPILHVFPIWLEPNIDVEVSPKTISTEPEEERVSIKVKGKISADGISLKGEFIPSDHFRGIEIKTLLTSETGIPQSFYDSAVFDEEGNFGSIIDLASLFFELYEKPVTIDFKGPLIYYYDMWCNCWRPLAVRFFVEKDGKTACVLTRTKTIEIPRSGCAPSFSGFDSTYKLEDKKLSCEIKPKISAEGCNDYEWEIRDYKGEVICSGKVQNNMVDTSACTRQYSFEGEFARLLPFKLKIGKLEREANALCGDASYGVLVGGPEGSKFLCSKLALTKIDSKYKVDLSKCTWAGWVE